MAYTTATLVPEVVVLGSGRVVEGVYKGDGSTTFKKGDLVRVNTSGQIKNSGGTSASPPQGMIVDDWDTAPTTSQFVTVFMFGDDTVLKMQVASTLTPGTEIVIGDYYTISDGASGHWMVTDTETAGCALCVNLPGRDYPAEFANDALANGVVYVRFTRAMLDVAAA